MFLLVRPGTRGYDADARGRVPRSRCGASATSADGASNVKIFLSHTSRDKEIAAALKGLIAAVFGGAVEVSFSSDQEAGAGVMAGVAWRRWINKEIREADQMHVLLTPNSLGRPWILWESGVAAGVSIGSPDAGKVIPVLFGLSPDDVPSPLQDIQAVNGDKRRPNGGADRRGARSRARRARPSLPGQHRGGAAKRGPGRSVAGQGYSGVSRSAAGGLLGDVVRVQVERPNHVPR